MNQFANITASPSAPDPATRVSDDELAVAIASWLVDYELILANIDNRIFYDPTRKITITLDDHGEIKLTRVVLVSDHAVTDSR